MSDPRRYTVGWICAVQSELVAALQFLDGPQHEQLESTPPNDDNNYVLGTMGNHNVVIATLPMQEYGIASAAAVASHLQRTFTNIRVGLMVGIGGGAPSSNQDVRLGDIVVNTGGVHQYDFGKTMQDRKLVTTGDLNRPPRLLRARVNTLAAQHANGNDIHTTITALLKDKQRLNSYRRPPLSSDVLYRADYIHQAENQACQQVCGSRSGDIVSRPKRGRYDHNPAVHHGKIASANQVMKDAMVRDALVAEHKVLCFEMEAAGLANNFPCLVIRGICDYADSHKNKQWQGYAAMAAAAYAKQLLAGIPPHEVELEQRAVEILEAKLRTFESDTTRRAIRDWLLPVDASKYYNEALRQRSLFGDIPTGIWFIECQAFQSFQQGCLPFLWINGTMGCGKTVLISTVIEHVKKCSTGSSPTCLYFYFTSNENSRAALDDALRCLIWQLVSRHNAPTARLHDEIVPAMRYGEEPKTDQLLQMLTSMLELVGSTILIIDALDECTTKSELTQWLKSLATQQTFDIRIICTSRTDFEINSKLEEFIPTDSRITLQQADINMDIRKYVRARINTKIVEWGEDLGREIEDQLMERARGMFKLVACYLDQLDKCITPQNVTDTLGELPDELTKMYTLILDKIPRLYRKDLIRLLQVLIYSPRPMYILEAVDFLAVELNNARGFDPKKRAWRPLAITKMCPSLMTVVTLQNNAESMVDYSDSLRNYRSKGVVQELHISHQSVREYLLSEGPDDCLRTSLREVPATTTIAGVCLKYLSQLGIDSSRERIRSELPLSFYSARYWMQFSRIVETEEESVRESSLQLLRNEEAHGLCLKLYDPDRASEKGLENSKAPGSPLYYASLGGLKRTTETLIHLGFDVNAVGGKYGSALQAACHLGAIDVVDILLNNGADINATNGRFSNALHAAVIRNHPKIVQRLLQEPVNLEASTSYYGTALQAASSQGYGKIVDLLLKKPVNVNAGGGYYGNALHAACVQGFVSVVRILLRSGANVQAQGKIYSTPLHAACVEGRLEVVVCLLEHHADVHARDPQDDAGGYGTALQAASRCGHLEIVRLLLRNGADVNSRGGSRGTALEAARYGGHREVEELLLSSGADSNLESSIDSKDHLHMSQTTIGKGGLAIAPGVEAECSNDSKSKRNKRRAPKLEEDPVRTLRKPRRHS